MKYCRTCGIVVSLFFAVSTANADDLPPQSSGSVLLRQCLIEYERTAVLGANQAGILHKAGVRMGDRVKAGQVLGRMQDEDLRADLEYKSAAAAASDVEVRMDEKSYEGSMMKLRILENLRQNKYTSEEEYRLQKLTAENAKLAVEGAKNRRRLAQLQCRIAEASLRIRQIVSPIDGVVVEVAKTEGESIGLADPVFRVVDPSLLRITGAIDVTELWRVEEGDTVRVVADIGGVDIPIEHQEFEGKVTFVSRQIDPASQTGTIVAQVENRPEILRAGLRCTMSISPRSAAKAGKTNDPKSGTKPGEKAIEPHPSTPARVARDESKRSNPSLKSDL